MKQVRKALLLALLSVLSLAPLCALAQPSGAPPSVPAVAETLDLDLEQLLRQQPKEVSRDVEVSTASRFAQSATQAPSVTYVLTAADIARYGLRNMADILRTMPGLYITSDLSFTYVGARGLGRPGDLNARLLFLIDGVRINENVYDAGQIGGEFYIDADLIERVEYAPGPGSALYGNNAFLGVVNVMTKRADKLAGAAARLGFDSSGQKQLRGSWGYRSESGWEGWLAASEFRQERKPLPYVAAAEDVNTLRNLLWTRGKRLFGSFNAGGLALRVGTSSLSNGIPEFLREGPPVEFGQAKEVIHNHFVSLGYERSLGADWDVFFGVSAKSSEYSYRYPSLDPGGRLREWRSGSWGRWSNWELRLSGRQWADHRLMTGLEYQYDSQQRIAAGLVGEAPLQEFNGKNRRLGVFLQDEWRLTDQHRLILGLRHDKDEVGSSSLNPRLAWIWSGAAPDATLKLMYGSAFRAANLSEFQTNAPWGEPTPKPERVRTLELAWDQALSSQMQYRVSIYASQLQDLISLNQVDLPLFQNQATMRSRGLELGLDKRWDQGSELRAGLSLQRSTDAQGQGLGNSPRALLKLLFSQPLLGENLQASWQVFAMSRRTISDGELPGYLLNNVNLLWRPRLDLDLSLGVYNLGAVDYFDRTSLLGEPVRREGRVWQLSVTWRFGS
ncbi:TonB-dependent receptor [Paucibacter sp. AS339]|uniref:TonB-dependent receptor plug domain-containing protein n=1 Tax=Paucibacter hankyongi TaxID=3133434 RepID=UPI0030AACA15